jgi:AcrR family transcriptional regulator
MFSADRPDERLLETAYELFSARGVRDVGVDELVEKAGVAKATLYRHFSSKDELILAFLQLREDRWTVGWLEENVRARGGTPEDQLLVIFDLFDEWFHEPEFAGCPFIRVLLEMGTGHPTGAACIEHLEIVRDFLAELATEAGFREPGELALSLQLLLCGSIIHASAGFPAPAQRAKVMARALMGEFRQPATES